MSAMDDVRGGLRKLALVSTIPGEDRKGLINRQVYTYRVVHGPALKLLSWAEFATDTLDRVEPPISLYLEGSARNRPLALQLQDLGMATCSCGWVTCEGCEVGS